jgi:hypothetical protein
MMITGLGEGKAAASAAQRWSPAGAKLAFV